MDSTQIMIRAEATPNPASMRFILDRPVLEEGAAKFTSTMQAEASPLAMRLFMLPMVTSVFLGPNFVTVTAESGDWATLREQVSSAIRAHYESGQPVMLEESGNGHAAEAASASEVEAGIIRVINEEIRPAVAMDGGDVLFVAFKDGIVHLRLRGACSGCPSAVFTLKMGIERRLKQEFPEIVAVQQI
jgi:Fe-S cluster biogenesis protein NfuA